jgi:peptide chain release factor 1
MIDRLGEVEARYEEISRELSSPEAASDPSRLADLGRELARLEPIVNDLRAYRAVRDEMESTRAMLDDPDEEMRAMARDEMERLHQREVALESRLRSQLVPRDPNDDRNVILEIRAGAGGEEASLFAADLYRMYARYAERRRWKVEVMSTSESEAGGFKEIIAELRGDGAYSRLKFESGVHRVQRVPVTEAQGRIHTSTATVSVLPEADEVEVDIDEKDLRVDVYRSSGPGGQSVNTTDSAVRITHLPTGTVVSCQNEKSQLQNREAAMRVLRARLHQIAMDQANAASADIRASQVRTVDRSERIRTYNFPENRISDHRTGFKAYNLDAVLDGDLDPVLQSCVDADEAARLAAVADR